MTGHHSVHVRRRLPPALCSQRLLAASPVAAQKAEPCIAGSWELSGPIAHTGAAVRMGVETAVDEINEAGGVLGQKLTRDRLRRSGRAVARGR